MLETIDLKLTPGRAAKDRTPELTVDDIKNGFIEGDKEYHGMSIDQQQDVWFVFQDMVRCCLPKEIDVSELFGTPSLNKIGAPLV